MDASEDERGPVAPVNGAIGGVLLGAGQPARPRGVVEFVGGGDRIDDEDPAGGAGEFVGGVGAEGGGEAKRRPDAAEVGADIQQ